MDEQSLPVAAPATLRKPNILSGSTLAPLRNLADQPAVKRALPAVGLVGVAGVAVAAWLALQSPSQVPLFQGLSDTDKAAVAEALRTSGTDYTIDAATGSIGVDEAMVHEARMLLAAQGLPKSVPSGDAAIAALPMGSSRAVETETLRGARESDLARTIEAIDTIKSARVHIANSEPSAFVRDQAGPQASVMLVLYGGRSLSQPQVRAVRYLVSSSVPGMTADKVSVIDQSGALLSQHDATADDPTLQMQARIEDRYREALVALIGPVVGRDNLTAEVHADIDLTESQMTLGQSAQDALFRIDGVAYVRAANTVSDTLPGLTLTLKKAEPGTIQTVSAAPPVETLKQTFSDFVNVFNTLKIDLSNARTSSGDSALRTLERQLLGIVSTPLTGDAAFGRLADVGVRTNRDGGLSIDTARLEQVLRENPQAIEAMFNPSRSATQTEATDPGILSVLRGIEQSATAETGPLGAIKKRLDAAAASLATDRARMEAREDAYRVRLERQFGTMDARIAAFKATQSYLEQQIKLWSSDR